MASVQISASLTVKVTFRLDDMSSGGSLKVKAPSFTSILSLIDQPPASSWNLSSKMTSPPSQAIARHEGAALQRTKNASNTNDLDMDAPRWLRLTRPRRKILNVSTGRRQLRGET